MSKPIITLQRTTTRNLSYRLSNIIAIKRLKLLSIFSVELSEKYPIKYEKVREVHISPYCRLALVPPNSWAAQPGGVGNVPHFWDQWSIGGTGGGRSNENEAFEPKFNIVCFRRLFGGPAQDILISSQS